MPEFPMMYGCLGVNNKVDPMDLLFDDKTGLMELSYGLNVDVELPSRLCSRKGTTLVTSGDIHSLYYPGKGRWGYYVLGGGMYRFGVTGVAAGIRNVTKNAWMSYADIGDVTFYTNGFETGYISREGVSYSWARPTGSPSPPDYADSSRVFDDPPVGTVLAEHNGRVYVAVRDTVFASELYWYAYFNLEENRLPFDSNVQAMGSVTDGMYISDESGVYYCKGDYLQEMQKIPLPPEFGPVIPGTMCKCDGKLVNDMYYGDGLIWVSKYQVCYGGPGGTYQDLSSEKLVLPETVRGAACMYNKQYYFVLHQ